MGVKSKIVIGNWKMNGSAELVESFTRTMLDNQADYAGIRVVLCPPFTLLQAMADALEGGPILLGAQNVSEFEQGAHTGEISAPMLASMGTKMVIIGHSERRASRGENDRIIAAKVKQALSVGMVPVLCVGETAEEKARGDSEAVVWQQLSVVLHAIGSELFGQLIVAYEPIWAIGSGSTASTDDILTITTAIHAKLAQLGIQLPLLYGGSVNAGNAAQISSLPTISGLLVGGASLQADQFLLLCSNTAKGA